MGHCNAGACVGRASGSLIGEGPAGKRQRSPRRTGTQRNLARLAPARRRRPQALSSNSKAQYVALPASAVPANGDWITQTAWEEEAQYVE